MKKKLLIIEDDALLLSIYAEKFALEGFDVMLSRDGADGLARIKADRPAAVLLDLVLPKMTGLELLEALRREEDAALRSIPVIVVTNIGHDADIKKALSLGAKGYLIKSDTALSEVIARVRSLFASAKGVSSEQERKASGGKTKKKKK